MNKTIVCIVLSAIIIYSCNQTSYPYGERLFAQNCADCHMDKGEGVANLYPSLLTEKVMNQIDIIPCIIRHGKSDSTTLLNMLALPDITEIEMTNIINFIICDLNKSEKVINLEETKSLLLNCN